MSKSLRVNYVSWSVILTDSLSCSLLIYSLDKHKYTKGKKSILFIIFYFTLQYCIGFGYTH